MARGEVWVRGAHEHTRPVAGTVDPLVAEDQGLLFLDVAQQLFQALMYVRTYPLIPPHCIHVRTCVRTYAYARTLQQRMFVGTYVHIFYVRTYLVGPAVSEVPGGEEGNWLEWEPRS